MSTPRNRRISITIDAQTWQKIEAIRTEQPTKSYSRIINELLREGRLFSFFPRSFFA